MRQASDEALADATIPLLKARGQSVDGETRAKLIAAMPGLKERAKTLVELAEGAYFLIAKRPLALDDKAQKLLTPDARSILKRLLDGVSGGRYGTRQALDAAARHFAEQNGLKLGCRRATVCVRR